MKEKDIYYIEIPDPVNFRRSVLEASRDLLQGLQKFEDLNKVRAEKAKEVNNLKVILKEIGAIITQARNMLPVTNIKMPDAQKPEKQSKPKKSSSKKEAEESSKKHKPREVAELESQLKDIEKKLGSLG